MQSNVPAPFTGLWIPLITPFLDGTVDHAALAALVRGLRPCGIAGFVACGSTGEAAALDADEQLAVLDTVLAAADGLPVVMGIGGYHLPRALAAVAEAGKRQIAGLLIAPPCYVRPAQAGLLDWFRTLADASPVPVMLYDIPYRTGAELHLPTLLALAEHPRIWAVKDCGGDAAKTQALIADGRLAVLAGEDAQLFGTLALGGAGAIAASAHLHTARFVHVMSLLADDRLQEARALWQPLQPWIRAIFSEPNPGPIKALLAHAGAIGPGLRAPMTPASDGLLQRLLALQEGFSRP
ncbi:4-hydroxy-tetrahydrodipicolinate synthase [Pseudorhodoferax sp. Leaf267]|nr:4-hydroxy-tetrahydrodipicolinate synthase [Pseudorhodoferax sp. Leaf267]